MPIAVARGLLLVLAALVVAVGRLTDPSGLAGSPLNLTRGLTTLSAVGLWILGQQIARRAGAEDLGAAATAALASVVVIGLTPGLAPAGAVGAALLVAVMVGVSLAALLPVLRAPAALVTLLPVALVPALLPRFGARLGPEALDVFASGTLGVWVPWLFVVYAVALGLLALLQSRPLAPARAAVADEARPILAFAAAGLIWGVLGLWQAGLQGAATELELAPALLGLGAALALGAGPRRRIDAWTSLALACLLAALLNVLALRADLGGAVPEPERAEALLAALLLGLGLRRRGRSASAHAGEVEVDRAGGPPLGVDDRDGERLPLAGRDVED